jgi:hypothetical protein
VPAWSPRWDDVAVDIRALHHAAWAARVAALDLDRWSRVLGSRADGADAVWRGAEPGAILAEVRRCAADAGAEAVRLAATARQLDTIADEAVVEQARRQADRLRWHAEADAERRLAEMAFPHGVAVVDA